jgi:hypothetical protein
MGGRPMNDNELPEGFMDHLQFIAADVPEDELPPLLPPDYPLIFVSPAP